MSFKWTYPIDSGLCDRIALSNFRTIVARTLGKNGSLRVRSRTDRWALNKNNNNSGSTPPPPPPSDFLLRNVPSSILPRFVNNQLVTANLAFLWIMTLLIKESIRHLIHSFFSDKYKSLLSKKDVTQAQEMEENFSFLLSNFIAFFYE